MFQKPILEYVVFCHQEDTLWPFYEAKTLKEIFDKIFQTDEFQKVLDHIKKDVKSFEKENPAKMQGFGFWCSKTVFLDL